jgi:hypothetical protein
MKTIIYIQILVRFFATYCIISGGYKIISSWNAIMQLNEIVKKQKENAYISNLPYDFSSFIPSYLDILQSPLVTLAFGLVVFFGAKQLVQVIIGRQQVDILLHADKIKTQN